MNKSSKYIIFITLKLFVFFFTLSSCENKDDENLNQIINPDIVTLVTTDAHGNVNFRCASWTDDNYIYPSSMIKYYKIDDSLRITDEQICDEFRGGYFNSYYKDKLLYVFSIYRDASYGSLYEMKEGSCILNRILDSTHMISSAHYYKSTDSIIYYSSGNLGGKINGFYLYTKTNYEDSLLLEFNSQKLLKEYINGFDVHPFKPQIVFGSQDSEYNPIILRYDFEKQILDTLDIEFDPNFGLSLWLRYNPSGDKLVYCLSSNRIGLYEGLTETEIGIIDIETRSKRILDVNPYKKPYSHFSISPSWSPTGNEILYSSSILGTDGSRANYALFLIKNL